MNGIISGVVMAVLVCAGIMMANWVTQEEDDRYIESSAMALAIILGLLVGAAWMFVPVVVGTNLAFLAPIAAAAMACITVVLVVMWTRVGSDWYELLAFVCLYLLLFIVTQRCASATAKLVGNEFWRSLITAAPGLLFTIATFISAIDLLRCHKRQSDAQEKEGEGWSLIMAMAIALGIALVCLQVGLNIKWNALNAPAPVQAEAEAEVSADAYDYDEYEDVDVDVVDDYGIQDIEYVVDESNLEKNWMTYEEFVKKYSWLVFPNFELQSDGDPDNNANLGPNRYHEDWDAMDYYRDWKSTLPNSIYHLVASVAAADAIRGTSLTGDYYNGNDCDWSKTMNALVEDCLMDRKNSMHLADVFMNLLDNEVRSVYMIESDDIHDQIYISPYTYSGIPELVASETHQSGHVLVIVFKRKGGEENDVKMGLRVECDYNVTDVMEAMNLPNTTVNPPEHTSVNPNPDPNPQPNPDPSPKPTSKPDPDPKPKPQPDPTPTPTPKPDPEPDVKYKKDKTKGTEENTEPNDDPGPGPDTNNGDGAQYSTKDQEENSNHMSQEEYNETVKKLEETNQTQKTGEDSSNPSTTGPADTKVETDNNGDTGNGGAPINTPTEVTAPETVKGDPQSEGMIEVPD